MSATEGLILGGEEEGGRALPLYFTVPWYFL